MDNKYQRNPLNHITIQNSPYTIIENQTFDGVSIEIINSSHTIIRNNFIRNIFEIAGSSIFIKDSYNVTIFNNTISQLSSLIDSDSTAIKIIESDYVISSYNKILDINTLATLYGFYVYGGVHIEIHDNQFRNISSSNTFYPIYAANTEKGFIIDNSFYNITANQVIGISLIGTHNSFINDNSFRQLSSEHVRLIQTSHTNRTEISDNTGENVYSNSTIVISAYSDNEILISSNTFIISYNNYTALKLDRLIYSIVTQNNFSSNTHNYNNMTNCLSTDVVENYAANKLLPNHQLSPGITTRNETHYENDTALSDIIVSWFIYGYDGSYKVLVNNRNYLDGHFTNGDRITINASKSYPGSYSMDYIIIFTDNFGNVWTDDAKITLIILRIHPPTSITEKYSFSIPNKTLFQFVFLTFILIISSFVYVKYDYVSEKVGRLKHRYATWRGRS